MEAATLGLRERKKLRTRQTIVDVALSLFFEQGYNGTTLAEVAANADIAQSTLFNYFPAKIHIVFGIMDAAMSRPANGFSAAA